MLKRIREIFSSFGEGAASSARGVLSAERHFFAVLPQADRTLAITWWTVLLLRGSLPAGFAIAVGTLVDAVESGAPLAQSLTILGVLFIALQTLAPVHAEMGSNLGSKTAGLLNDRLLATCSNPPGMRHLEQPALTADLTLARDFDLGISGPPMNVSIGFIAGGLVELVAGITSALVLCAYHWWAALVLATAWASTHWLLRESTVWRDRNTDAVKEAQRHADYTYRLAVDAPASKEVRLFGLADWVVDRFAARRRQLVDLRWHATRLRQRPLRWTFAVVLGANALVFWLLASEAADGALALGSAITFAQAAVGVSALAFGGFSWALSIAAQAVEAVRRLERPMAEAGALPRGDRPATALPRREIRFRNVTFRYADDANPVLEDFDLAIPAGTSLAIVGVNGAGKTTLAKLLCRLYDPQSGAVEIDGIDLRSLDVDAWRKRVTAVFQDFVRYELPLRDNVAPTGAPDAEILAALEQAGARQLATLDTMLARGYPGGTDLSGGQWQRVALARALCAVRLGAGVVLLDEPTAQLDVRGEAEIFERILAATRSCTTVLISHRFSTVRHADRICVLEAGRVVELGSHQELMDLGGRYRTLFELQAARFAEETDGISLD